MRNPFAQQPPSQPQAQGQNPFSSMPLGMMRQGNIDLAARPIVENRDGTYSTVRSITVGFDDGTYVLPTVSDDGRILTPDQAIDLFRRTGRHLGVFKQLPDAERYSQDLHNQQADYYGQRRGRR